MPDVNERRAPDDAATIASLDAGSGVGQAGAVGEAPLPALVDSDGRILRRVRRVRQLHAAQRQEAVPGAVEPREAPAPSGAVPELPVPRRRRREPVHAGARRRAAAGVAGAEGAAVRVVVALVPRQRPVEAPPLPARRPHVALHARLVQHEPRHDTAVAAAAAAVHQERVVHVAGVVDELELEVAVVGLHLRLAAELQPVPRPVPVHGHRAVAPYEPLGDAAEVEPERVVARRRVAGAPPRRQVPVEPRGQVPPELHAREQGVGRVIEALPQDGATPSLKHEVAAVQQLRPDRGASAAHVGLRRRPEHPPRGVGEHQAAGGVDGQARRGAGDRGFPVGDPDNGLGSEAHVPDAQEPRRRAGRGEEAQLEHPAR
uniref:Uncharacterized protein n=1 Tax=Zea mays TaxID=4577 RepID=A0A804QFR2_MAIZE